ncbi:hypothetical protein PENSUB_6439 [Penicillium subrubescens]|uniref:Uncharacterized protein n=1 Tax=Penicillium subrubescens TaxID=1316194 RepID=A0A1Q5U1U0_9EURO|nr:hypothetical protein PENSUB_6439 [Penicillium subrubescens]
MVNFITEHQCLFNQSTCSSKRRFEKMAKFEDFIDPSRLSWSKAVVAVVEKELGSEMGTVYRKAVQFCLVGIKGFK